jgi:phenylalanyl-tRNA synthetase alpha chain
MTTPNDDISPIQTESLREAADAVSIEALDAVHAKYLGRKDGVVTRLLQKLPTLPNDQKKDYGRRVNELKNALESAISDKRRGLESARLTQALLRETVDLSLPEVPVLQGGLHPLTRIQDEIVSIFKRLGFNVAEGPEVETDFHNFTALNHPPDHPARDAHDTFYLKTHTDDAGAPLLLRTHTSPVQIRYMKSHKPPLYIVAPGRVFRHEAVDATHSFVFHQVEGLAVDKGISLADLKGALTLFARELFGSGIQVRFRPSYFPFVEPGLEVDISCAFCGGKGCRVCKQTGWVEMLGSGLVHANVLRGVGLDPDVYSGYAFGIGVERVAMFKFGVDDMRLFYENDLRFLRQF